MTLSNLIKQCRHLRTTVNTSYGIGIKSWVRYIYYSLFRKNKFLLLQANLQEPLKQNEIAPGLTFQNLSIRELEVLRNKEELPREFFCDQFHKVTNCLVGLVAGEMAYIHWVYFEGEFSRFLKFGSDSAELNYVTTLPKFRGRGIALAAVLNTMEILKKQGFKRLLAVVHEDNFAIIKSLTRAGFVEVGSTVSVGPFNRKTTI